LCGGPIKTFDYLHLNSAVHFHLNGCPKFPYILGGKQFPSGTNNLSGLSYATRTVYLLDFDNCDPRLAKPTAAGDVSDVLQIGRELLIGTSRGQLASLLAGEAYDSIIKFGQHAGGPNSSPWGATANRRGHQKTITQQHKQHLESEEAAGASKAKQLLERALEVTALTSGEADSVNPTSVGYVPTSAVMASAVPLAPPQPAQSSKKVKKK
jgi:hypothetical protein